MYCTTRTYHLFIKLFQCHILEQNIYQFLSRKRQSWWEKLYCYQRFSYFFFSNVCLRMKPAMIPVITVVELLYRKLSFVSTKALDLDFWEIPSWKELGFQRASYKLFWNIRRFIEEWFLGSQHNVRFHKLREEEYQCSHRKCRHSLIRGHERRYLIIYREAALVNTLDRYNCMLKIVEDLILFGTMCEWHWAFDVLKMMKTFSASIRVQNLP